MTSVGEIEKAHTVSSLHRMSYSLTSSMRREQDGGEESPLLSGASGGRGIINVGTRAANDQRKGNG